MLFGSRARNENRDYSDYDLGIYSASGIEHKQYLAMIELKDHLSEDLPFYIDLINLNTANPSFIKNISSDWRLVSGNISHWLDLQQKAQNGTDRKA